MQGTLNEDHLVTSKVTRVPDLPTSFHPNAPGSRNNPECEPPLCDPHNPATETKKSAVGATLPISEFLINMHKKDPRIMEWVPYQNEYLNELLWSEGQGADSRRMNGCVQCGASKASFRCRECSGGDMLCASCTLTRHQNLPLHRIDVRSAHDNIIWNFVPISSRLGNRISFVQFP